jgi:hypothetical protein
MSVSFKFLRRSEVTDPSEGRLYLVLKQPAWNFSQSTQLCDAPVYLEGERSIEAL